MDDSVQGPRLRRIVLSNSQHAVLPVSLPWKTKTHEMVKSVEALPPADPWGRDQQCYFLSSWHSLPLQRGISPSMGSVPFALLSSVWPLVPFHWLAPCQHPHYSSTPAFASALWAISAHPSPRPTQQDQSSKKQMWNSSQKAAGRPDWLPQSCRNDIPTVLILLRRCSHACGREGKVNKITMSRTHRIIIFYMLS